MTPGLEALIELAFVLLNDLFGGFGRVGEAPRDPHISLPPVSNLKVTDGWELVARDLGLDYRKDGAVPSLSGELHGRPLRVQIQTERGRYETRVRLGGLPEALEVASRGKGSVGEGLGDPTFDERVAVHGPREVLLRLFDHENRTFVRLLLTAQPDTVLPSVRQGWAVATATRPLDGESLRALIDRCVRLADALSLHGDPVAHLEEMVRHDPVPRLRMEALQLLLEQGIASEELVDEARGADISALRLVVASHERDTDTLVGLARDTGIAARVRMLAVQALGEHNELPLMAELAEVLCRRNPHRSHSDDEAVARQIATTLKDRSPPADVWVPYVHAGWPTLTVLALDQLAQHGEKRHLTAIASRRDEPPPVGPAARRALLSIRQRLGSGEIGTLSLATEQGTVGAMSISPAGRLSEPD